jgi:hypothetical protein
MDIPSKWHMNRKGAFGITVPKGTALEVSKLRIKLLR